MYAYCYNNPVAYRDSVGEFPVILIIAFTAGFVCGALVASAMPSLDEMAEDHYARNELNDVDADVEEIMNTFDKVSEGMDKYHENTDGKQGDDAIYNDKYLSPDGGHLEVIICCPPNRTPYIVDETVDPLNMGTYNYASNDQFVVFYGIGHFLKDMVPYYFFGNTREDEAGWLKWALR